MEWSNLYRGVAMGISDLIPGVSGGTVAFILGIYDRLLEAIGGILSSEWRRHIGFLLPLGIGMGAALLGLSRVIWYLLEHHFVPTQFFFMGLIIGVLPFLLKQADVKRNFAFSHWIALAVGAVAAASMAFAGPERTAAPIEDLSLWMVVGLFLSGSLASAAMLLPGISGSFVLLVLGVYPTAIYALSTFHIPLIVTIGAGVVVGFIVSSRAIRYMLARYPNFTHAVIIGLIVGSVVVVYPGFPIGAAMGATIAISLISFVAGLGLALAFGARDPSR